MHLRATRNAGDNDGYDRDYHNVPQKRRAVTTFLEGVHLVVFIQCVHLLTRAGVDLVVSVIEEFHDGGPRS